MMMMSSSERNYNNRYPFTASQWQELEQQALVFKYMVSGMPIPPDLIFTVRTSLDSSLSSKLLLHQSPQIGWNGYHMGRKIDPEPGRCRRTDGKKWRCSKDAYPDSKYCERHMHRGRNRSRKPVENTINSSSTDKPSAIHVPTKNTLSISDQQQQQQRFLYDPTTTRFIGLSSSQETTNTNKFFLESNDYDHSPYKAYRNGDGVKVESDAYFSEAQLGFSLSQLKENNKAYYSSSAGLGNGSQQNYYYNNNNNNNNIERDSNNNININDQPAKKVMHHFLDDWSPKDRSNSNNWPNIHSDHQDNFSITNMNTNNNNNTQLSMSIPNSSLHDFFMTQK